MDDLPTDSSPLGDAAVALHEMYRSLIEAGFDEWAAMEIVKEWMKTGIKDD